ncbi:EI24 domain-containing protein [Lipingzhangella sp. LS1_29]|uniref:EI24 domain-containing protein n=1 Tax=Lipingzhangella rawalii TaxID=2055835 RepID=A0ABU2H5T7_9ACTN|nr:EI24 domain-containing protein [Lipingzhangella rawalii]MDS1270671.1 EI24 domain-containing protein [Lipingzhangella rawalii]
MFAALGSALGGATLLFRGAGVLVRRPRLFLLGAVPPLITTALFLAALVTLLVTLDSLVVAVTPFADNWGETWQLVTRIALAVAMVGGAVLLLVVAFTAVTLALGSPIYDRIAEEVDAEHGDVPEANHEGRLRSVVRGVRQSLATVLVSLLITVAVLLIGFVPLVGTAAAPVLSALLGGWVLAVELLGPACDRRGRLQLADRIGLMRRDRARVLGFAVPAFALLAVPFLAIVVFPAAAAGGSLLARDLVATPGGSSS